MKIIKYGLLLSIIYLLSGCAGKTMSKVTEEEVGKYEKMYFAEYEQIKKKNKEKYANYQEPFKWIQPKNKKESCKVYVSINPNDDKTEKSDYSLFWDGECKDGYAYGLGREIENTMLNNIQQIGYYEKGKAVKYYVSINSLDNVEVDGECSYNNYEGEHTVMTRIQKKMEI